MKYYAFLSLIVDLLLGYDREGYDRDGYRDYYAEPPRYDRAGYRTGGRSGYHHDNGRANYHEGTRHRFDRRGTTEKTTSMYNKDGSINWSYKAQGPRDDLVTSRRQHYNPYEDDYRARERYGEPRNYYDSGYYRDAYYNDDAYYDDDYQEKSRYEPYYDHGNYGDREFQNGDQRGRIDRGQQYDDERFNRGRQNDVQQDRPSRGQPFDDGQYGRELQTDAQQYDGQQDGSQNQNSDGPGPRVLARYGQTGGSFGTGLRLAGALPDDGYNRGLGTFYDLETHVGGCGQQHKNTELVASVNSEQMNNSCGKEVEIVGPSGKMIKALVVDSCKTCQSGGLDLSPAGKKEQNTKLLGLILICTLIAYDQLGEFSHGSVPIKWKFV